MGPEDLRAVMDSIIYKDDNRVVVSFHDSDDAGAIKAGGTILLQTVDIITPVVPDPFVFGQIAAANALSDIFAMGGTPISALNIAAFPADCLDLIVLREILEGGKDKLEECNTVVIGGHTITDKEIKYGLSVLGEAGKEIYRNNMATEGLDIILTKPLGGGIISTALKGNAVIGDVYAREMTMYMARLNKYAAESAIKAGIVTMTDITGFGLLGHLYEVVKASKLSCILRAELVPFMSGFDDYFSKGLIPAGAYRNGDYISPFVDGGKDDVLRLSAPETSGGLLIFCLKKNSRKVVEAIRAAGDEKAKIIGETISLNDSYITIE